MNLSKLKEFEKRNKDQNLYEKLYKGACVKIKNSKKTFQVIGINLEKEICWIREWPFATETKKTFAMDVNQITIQIFCSNILKE